jgi:hypothetical protein
MLDLQPLIGRLVDDLLRVIRGASVEELYELFGTPEGDPGRPRRGRTKSPSKHAARPVSGRASRPARAVAARSPAGEPPLHSEITDPESLLAASALEAPRESVRPHPAPAPDEEPSPPRDERHAARANVALRHGESVARASDHGGIVIRRKRA